MSPELLSSSTKETSGRLLRNSRIARATSGWNGAEVVKPTAMRPISPRAVRRARILACSTCAQDRLGVGQEGAAGVGQADAARMAHEQGGVDLALERADLLAERRLLHAQLLGRARDVALMGDGDEVAEMAQFHGHIDSSMEWQFTIYLNTG